MSDCFACLFQNFFFKINMFVKGDTTGVNDARLHPAPGEIADVAGAGGSRYVRHNGETLLHNAVEQRRFANINAANQGNGGNAEVNYFGATFGHKGSFGYIWVI